jgi:hypothetical protein
MISVIFLYAILFDLYKGWIQMIIIVEHHTQIPQVTNKNQGDMYVYLCVRTLPVFPKLKSLFRYGIRLN